MTEAQKRALIAAAANAAGYRISNHRVQGGAYVTSATRRAPFRWTPLEDSKDALDLAALLRIPLWFDESGVIAGQRKCGEMGWRVEFGLSDGTREKATRLAIVRAAAHEVVA